MDFLIFRVSIWGLAYGRSRDNECGATKRLIPHQECLSTLVSRLVDRSIRFYIKAYNARSDWLKQRPLSENKVQVNDIKLAFKFLLRNFDKFDPN